MDFKSAVDLIENGHVPALSIVFMIISMLLSIAIPICLLIYLRKKYNCKLKAFFWGCIIWFVLVSIVETLAHNIVLSSNAGAVIQGNVWLYATYGAFMAALFEEVGRFIAMNYRLKDVRDNDYNAIMYGAGHGGIEAIYIVGIGMIGNIACAVMINLGLMGPTLNELAVLGEDAAAASVSGMASLITTSSGTFLLSIVERIGAMAAHIGMSIPVWFAVKNKKPALFFVSFIMHFVLDFASVIAVNYLPNLLLVELVIYIVAAGICALAFYIYKNNKAAKEADMPASEITL